MDFYKTLNDEELMSHLKDLGVLVCSMVFLSFHVVNWVDLGHAAGAGRDGSDCHVLEL
jgi:hypothetical protein